MKEIQSFFHHFFIPKESNNYKPKVLQLDFLSFYLIIALIFTVAVKQIKTGAVLGFATDITTTKLYELTNEQRAKNGLPPLKYNEKLALAAQNKAKNMFSQGYWAHFAPDGTTPWSFILGSGYQYSVAGENLAKGFYFSDKVVDAWMNSPSHRENLLRDNYQDVGFAVENGNLGGHETTLVVQMFGAPLTPVVAEDKSPQPQVTQAPIVTQAAQNPYYQPQNAVLAKKSTPTEPKFNLFPAFFNLNIIFLAFLALALVLDFYITKRMNILRVSGKNIAHLLFLGFVFIGIMIISKGGIIQ